MGSVPNIGIAMALLRGIAKKDPSNIWWEKTQPPSLAKRFADMFTSLYQLQAYTTKANHCAIQPLVFGAAEIRVLTAGSEYIAGIRIPDGDVSYKDYIKHIDSLDGAALATTFGSAPNFVLEAKAGDVVLLPAGFLYCLWSQRGSVAFRRSCSPSFEDEDATVKRTVALLLEAHPELQQSAWNDWHGYLLGQR